VIPGSFAYHRPTSIDDAVALLTQLGEDALAIAGGHSLIPMMKLRLATPDHLVDLAGVAELKGMRADGADVVIGAQPRYEVAPLICSRRNSDPCARPLC
jgi:carbon-monoxide dehydrogenase medium subunit